MPCTRKDEAPILVRAPEIEGRYVDLGDITVAFERFLVDVDLAPSQSDDRHGRGSRER